MTSQPTPTPPPEAVCGFVHTTGAIEWVCKLPPHGEPTFTPDGRPKGHAFRSRRRASTS